MNRRKVVRMIVLQILGVPLIALLLLVTIFMIGAKSVEPPAQPRWDEQIILTNNQRDLAHTASHSNLPPHGCDY